MKNANPVSQPAAALAAGLILLGACRKPAELSASVAPPPPAAAAGATSLARYSYEVVASWPHDPGAFTQGLVYRSGSFIESTGLNGHSTLREVDVKSGRILKQVALAAQYFGEGVAVLGSRIFQLTWQNGRCFVYDADTFQLQREFNYAGEGWGLATDGVSLMLSDGSHRIRFINPDDFTVRRTLDVTLNGQPRDRLNELEFVGGEIFANVWQTDEIVRIDPTSGVVRGVINLAGLLSPRDRTPATDVLNGIAYDASGDRLFVTGKRWPRVFEIKLKPAR